MDELVAAHHIGLVALALFLRLSEYDYTIWKMIRWIILKLVKTAAVRHLGLR